MKTYTDTQRLDYFEAHQKDFRYINSVSMDGKWPCWSVWTCMLGRSDKTNVKTLRGAIDLAIAGYEEHMGAPWDLSTYHELGYAAPS